MDASKENNILHVHTIPYFWNTLGLILDDTFLFTL